MKKKEDQPIPRRKGSSTEDDNLIIGEIMKELKSEGHLKTKMKKASREIRKKIKQKKDKQIQKMKDQIDNLKKKDEDPTYLIKRDEVIFSVMKLSFIFTIGLLFYPKSQYAFTFITVKNFILILVRFLDYRKKHWHYFLVDYCYTVIYLMAFALYFFNQKTMSYYLLSTFFVNATGPLLSAFVFFRYRIVYHDIDAYTSFYMHLTPALAAWIMRFHCRDNIVNGLPSTSEYGEWLNSIGPYGPVKIFLFGLGFYLTWAVLYYISIFGILSKRIKRKENLTLFMWAEMTSGFFNKLRASFGLEENEKLGQLLFMGIHLTCSIFFLMLSTFFFYNATATFIMLIIFVITPIWSSSTYYHEYFSNKYSDKITKRAEENAEKRLLKQEEKKKKNK